MLAVVGTVPDESFPLTKGPVSIDGDDLRIMDQKVSVNRGTPALIGAAVEICEALNISRPFAYLVGDIGRGGGSRTLYEHIEKDLVKRNFTAIVFHYLQPDVDWHNKILFALNDMQKRPVLIADAGFMYAAKMSGEAKEYDLFTPDVGELSFLADELAPHPFYTRGFILHDDSNVPDLIKRSYQHQNAAENLLVKGSSDYIVKNGEIMGVVNSPSSPAMEAVGGTGDTVTGIVSSLIASGMDITEACMMTAKINRIAGENSKPTPATQVMDIIGQISTALKTVMQSS